VILGCTYKADVSDVRESPIMELADILKKDARYIVGIIDPYIKQFNNDIYEAALNSDLLIPGVNHAQFRKIDFQILSRVMRGNNILDTRNYLNKREIVKNGLNYYLLGDAGHTLDDPVNEVAVTNKTSSHAVHV
jgi:UDP-N-acetyl-D-mannosaminuronic acid dehydrogenase